MRPLASAPKHMGGSVTPGNSKVSWQKREEEEPEESGDDGGEDGPVVAGVDGDGDDCGGELRLDGGQGEVG